MLPDYRIEDPILYLGERMRNATPICCRRQRRRGRRALRHAGLPAVDRPPLPRPRRGNPSSGACLPHSFSLQLSQRTPPTSLRYRASTRSTFALDVNHRTGPKEVDSIDAEEISITRQNFFFATFGNLYVGPGTAHKVSEGRDFRLTGGVESQKFAQRDNR